MTDTPTREALEKAKAAIWDAHYGNGLVAGYARSVDREISQGMAHLEALEKSHAELYTAAKRVLAGNIINSDPTPGALRSLRDAFENAKRLTQGTET